MLTVNRKQFLTALELVRHVTRNAGSMPILKTVKLEPLSARRRDDERLGCSALSLCATDLYTFVEAKVQASGDMAPAACDIRALIERTKRLTNGKALLGVDPPKTKDGAPRVRVEEGTRKYDLRAEGAHDFPPPPKADRAWRLTCLVAKDLADAIDHVLHAISLDETRAHLNSLLIELGPKTVRLVATDGHVLALWDEPRIDAPPGKAPKGQRWPILVSRSSVLEIHRLARSFPDETLTLSADDKVLFVESESARVAARIQDAVFPPYEQVIPQQVHRTFEVAVKPLSEAIKAMTFRETKNVVLLARTGTLEIESETPDGISREEVAIDYDEPATGPIGVNPHYLIDAMVASGAERVVLGRAGELDPIVVRAPGETRFVAVVMPTRLR